MDPATAFGIISAAYQIAGPLVADLYQYFESVKEAPERARKLRHEVATVCDLLDSLKEVLKGDASTSSGFAAPSSLNDSLRALHVVLEKLQEKVQAAKIKGRGRLKWPFSKAENEELLSEIERFKLFFTLELSIKSAYDLLFLQVTAPNM